MENFLLVPELQYKVKHHYLGFL